MDPENRNDYMIVVNKGSLLDENYKPDDLADLTVHVQTDAKLRR